METIIIIFLIFCLGAILIWHQKKQKEEIEVINLAEMISQDLYNDPDIKLQCNLYNCEENNSLDIITNRNLYQEREFELKFSFNYSISSRIQKFHNSKTIRIYVTVWHKRKEILKIKKEKL